MKILLHSNLQSPSITKAYNFISSSLNRNVEVEILQGQKLIDVSQCNGCDLIISKNSIPESIRSTIPSYGARVLTRVESMTAIQDSGFPSMTWSLASDVNEMNSLFSEWNVDKLILKKSFTSSGKGFHVVVPNQPEYGSWNPEKDIFCKEVNPNSGDFYKAEMFNGKLMLGWRCIKPALAERMNYEIENGYCCISEIDGRPERELWEFPENVQHQLQSLSIFLTETLKLGHISIDLMIDLDGVYRVIEFNTSPATWWTQQYSDVMNPKFLEGVQSLVDSHLTL